MFSFRFLASIHAQKYITIISICQGYTGLFHPVGLNKSSDCSGVSVGVLAIGAITVGVKVIGAITYGEEIIQSVGRVFTRLLG